MDGDLKQRVILGMDAMRVCMGMEPVNASYRQVCEAIMHCVDERLTAELAEARADTERLSSGLDESHSEIERLATEKNDMAVIVARQRDVLLEQDAEIERLRLRAKVLSTQLDGARADVRHLRKALNRESK